MGHHMAACTFHPLTFIHEGVLQYKSANCKSHIKSSKIYSCLFVSSTNLFHQQNLQLIVKVSHNDSLYPPALKIFQVDSKIKDKRQSYMTACAFPLPTFNFYG